jgi:hypothetical protein
MAQAAAEGGLPHNRERHETGGVTVDWLLPTTSRAWVALVGFVGVCTALAFTAGTRAAVIPLAIALAIALLTLGRIAHRAEANRSALGKLDGELRAVREELTRSREASDELGARLDGLRDEMVTLRLTVSQAASDVARQGSAPPTPR